MKKHILFFMLGIVSLSLQAQEAKKMMVTYDQYKQLKKEFLSEDRLEKVKTLDWAQFARYASANKEIARTPRVVFMGNSITDNWARMRPDFFTKNNFLGRGISGQTSSEMLVRFRADVINLHPKIVIINSGTNDIAGNNGIMLLENVLNNIISMAELAKANHIRPILSSVLPSNHMKWSPSVQPADSIIALNKMIREYAQNNKLSYIDYYSAMVDDTKGLPEKYSKDGVHPVDAGYEVMEAIVLRTLK